MRDTSPGPFEVVNSPSVNPPEEPEPARLLPTLGVGFCQNVVLAVARFAVPLIALELGARAATVGVLVALLTLAPILGMIDYGRWIDRAGPNLPSWVATALLFLASLAMLLTPGYGTLSIAALLIGAGANFGHVAIASSVGATAVLRIRARNLGYVVAVNSLAQFVGPALAGLGFDQLGARGAFLVAFAFAGVALVVLATPFHLLRGTPTAPKASSGRLRVRDLLTMSSLRTWLLANALFGGVLTLFPFVATLYGTSLHFSAAAIGGILSLLSLGSFASRVLNQVILRFVTPQRLMVISLCLAAIGYGVIPLLESWTALVSISFMLGMALGLGLPNTLALIYHTAPAERRTESASVALLFQNLLQLIAPVALGIVAATATLSTVFWVLSALLLAAAFLIRRAS